MFNRVVDSLNGNNYLSLANELIEQMEKCSSIGMFDDFVGILLSSVQYLGDTSMAEQKQIVGDVRASPRPMSNPKPTPSPARVLKLFFYLYNI